MSTNSPWTTRKSFLNTKGSSSPSNPTLIADEMEDYPISYKNEMVASFFTAMLVHIVDKKEVEEPPGDETSIPDAPLILKDFKDLLDNDLIQQEVVSVDGSQVSLGSKTKKMSQKRNSPSASKRTSQTQGSTKSNGSLSKKRKHMKSSSNALPRISESETAKNLHEVYNELLINNWRVKNSNEYVTITFKNANVYKGPLRNHLFHGEGTFFWNDGTIYFGHFENGEIDGFGKMIYADMSVYNGHFCHGKAHGMGAFFRSYSRTLYNGNWVHGKKEGKGWLYYSQRNWYDGEWHNDRRGGFGTRQYRNGSKYMGMWKAGNRNGQGACAFSNGDFYSGEWQNGVLQGYGEYTWKTFFNKSLTFPVENNYHGTWVNGMRDGFGHMYFGLEHGARLVGCWSMNFKHGMGIVINSNGDVTESNPLFFNDKPVHLSENNHTITSPPLTHHFSSINQKHSMVSNKVSGESQSWLLRTPVNEASCSTMGSILSDLKTVRSASSNRRPSLFTKSKGNSVLEQISHVQKIDRLQDFAEERVLCNPLIIHTRAAPETLNLTFYMEKYIAEAKDQMDLSSISGSLDWESSNDQKDSDDQSFWKDTKEHEMNNLRNIIWHNTKILQTVYEMYANISKDPAQSYRKCTLIRLYLWQLYRDLKIFQHGISLYDTDMILLENPYHCLETDHHPFERIYYWQFLWSLIGVAWQIHIDNKNKLAPFQIQSVYIVFEDFLKKTLYPMAGNHIGPCLFEFKNLLPINDVIVLYEHVGPELTARQFLNKCCCKKRTKPSCSLQHFGDNSVIQPEYGVNTIAVGRNFVYLPDEKDFITAVHPDQYPLEIDKFFKTLKVFRHIGPQRVLNCLTLACPIIKKDGLIVNMEVNLTFLEFYETMIYCAYKSVLLANLKERCKNFVFDRTSRSDSKIEKRKKSRKESRRRRK